MFPAHYFIVFKRKHSKHFIVFEANDNKFLSSTHNGADDGTKNFNKAYKITHRDRNNAFTGD